MKGTEIFSDNSKISEILPETRIFRIEGFWDINREDNKLARYGWPGFGT